MGSQAKIGILDNRTSECLFKLKGCGADVLPPFWRGIDLPKERIQGYSVCMAARTLIPREAYRNKVGFGHIKRAGNHGYNFI